MTNASITAPITSSITGLFPILHLGRPWFFYWLIPYPNKMDLWPQWRSPLVWDIFAICTYLIVSLLFWYIGLIPDLATLRDRTIPANCLWLVRARLARRGARIGRASRPPICSYYSADQYDIYMPGAGCTDRMRRCTGR